MKELTSFLRTIDQFKTIKRRSHKWSWENESDAEHARHLAMFVIIFREYYPDDINYERMLELCMIHDLPEIYAWDMFPFDLLNKDAKKAAELAWARKLFSDLPKELADKFMEIRLEFEEWKTKEAQIVRAFDKIQPDLQNLIYWGKNWQEYNISLQMLEDYKRKIVSQFKFTEILRDNIIKEWLEEGRLK